MRSVTTSRLIVASALLAIAAAVAADETPPEPPAARSILPATGQLRPYPAERPGTSDPVAVADDGTLRAGAPLRYRDNEDGTITDLTTGLMWEKKCSGCDGPHDRRLRLRWSGDGKERTVWDWLAEVNASGLGGHADWRIPNVKELVSIVDYGKANPAIDAGFATAACRLGCDDPTATDCSCTAIGEYWSSTTFSDFPAHALVVDFGMGFVDDRLKTNRHLVRAVRGGP